MAAAEPIAVDDDPSKVPARNDLPTGHWGKGEKLARSVWSGEIDKLAVGEKLIPVASAADVAAAKAGTGGTGGTGTAIEGAG